jgi:cell division protein FtsB
MLKLVESYSKVFLREHVEETRALQEQINALQMRVQASEATIAQKEFENNVLKERITKLTTPIKWEDRRRGNRSFSNKFPTYIVKSTQR